MINKNNVLNTTWIVHMYKWCYIYVCLFNMCILFQYIGSDFEVFKLISTLP